MTNWLDDLQKIRQAHQQAATEPPPPKKPGVELDQLLKESRAFELLRDVRRVLLGGVGRIELFEQAGGYDMVLALLWDGPVTNPRRPRSNSADTYHIFIGVQKNRLWVNGKPLKTGTATALQAALLEAARNPGRRKELRQSFSR